MRRRVPTAEKYTWLLTAEPPVCGRSGPPLRVLQTCERIRRDLPCYCWFDVGAITADLEAAGAGGVAEWFATPLEPDDIADLVRDVERIRLSGVPDDVADRLRVLHSDLRRLEEAGSGLTDEYSDDLD